MHLLYGIIRQRLDFKQLQNNGIVQLCKIHSPPKRYIFYAGGRLASAGYCRQCRQQPAILPLQLWQGCQVCVTISAQRLPRVAQFNAR